MITLQDLIDRFGKDELAQLTNENYGPDDKEIDEIVAAAAINDAVGDVASYLRSANLISVNALGNIVYRNGAELPDDLVRHTCNIARYHLYDNGVTETIEKRYDDAVKWLDKVKKDPSMLTGPVSEPVNTSGGISVMPNVMPSIYQD